MDRFLQSVVSGYISEINGHIEYRIDHINEDIICNKYKGKDIKWYGYTYEEIFTMIKSSINK